MGLRDVAYQIARIENAIPQAGNELKQQVALTIVTELAYKTPVDTSQALSNWQASIGVENKTQIKPHFPGEKGSTQRASADQTIQLAKAIIMQSKPGDTIYLTNWLPYIRRLDEGHSQQQPAGFIGRAVQKGGRSAKTVKLTIKV
jgi:hypothetical protein